MKKIISAIILGLILVNAAMAQQISPLWKDFEDAKAQNRIPVLPDFSFAGYHFSELPIPSVSGHKYFDVTKFGAIPNDDKFDDDAIQKTIDAAQKFNKPAVIFFPAGKFLIAPDEDSTKQILITKSNIILKGSGSGVGGTEIYQANKRIHGRQFLFKPSSIKTDKITEITQNASRETFQITVANASELKVGQDIIIQHRSETFTKDYFSPQVLRPQWIRLFGEKGGLLIFDIHTITKIEGNNVWFKNPIHLDIKLMNEGRWDILNYPSIEECGVEDILFTSNWKNYPEDFIHHKNQIHDYAYEAVGMEFVKNSWIRNCEFKDWNEGIFIRSGYKISVLNTNFTGKKGHASIHARTGYGVLIKNCSFNGAQHHGAGTGYSAVNTVITACSLGKDQNFDIHSGQPHTTLFDNITGGVFYNLGGPEPGYPHHGKNLVLWNFDHQSEKEQYYDFWDQNKRRNHTIPYPIFVGFTSDKSVTFNHIGINESQGKAVFPTSLFEAQLKLRLSAK